MYKILGVVLFMACLINVGCLLSHLADVAGPPVAKGRFATDTEVAAAFAKRRRSPSS
jgi:hypothetical protein